MAVWGTKSCSYMIIISQLNLQVLEILLLSVRLNETEISFTQILWSTAKLFFCKANKEIEIKSVSILRDFQNMTGHSPEQSQLALTLSLLWAGQTKEVPSNLIFFMMLYVTAFIPQKPANSRNQQAVWIVTALPSQGYFAAISSQEILWCSTLFSSQSLFLKSGLQTPPKSLKWYWCPVVRRERKIRLIRVTGVAHNQQFQELSEVSSIINGCCFHLQQTFFFFFSF